MRARAGWSRRAAAALAALALLIGAAPAAAAPAPAGARILFRMADPRITEASGIAPGLASPGVDYVENDSGDVNRFFAVDARTGATAATITVPGSQNVDWEDIAVAPDASGTPSVWLADIGDNSAKRDEVQVYRVPEPHVRETDRNRLITTPTADVWRLRYPDGPVNAESLAVRPDGTAFIVTKSYLGASSVYRVPAKPDRQHVQELVKVGAITFVPTGSPNPFGVSGQLTATSAAISRDGTLLAVRTYADVYVWSLPDGRVSAGLSRTPARRTLPNQHSGGEGVAFSGGRLLIDSEGHDSAVWDVPLPDGVAPPTTTPTATPTTTPSETSSTSASAGADPSPRANAQGSDGSAGWAYTAGGIGVAVLLGLGWLVRRRRHR